MNRSNQSRQQSQPNQENSKSREADEKLSSRITLSHGGEVLESIAPEELVPFNDADCKHVNLVRDDTETETNTFFCSNPNCCEVFIYDKVIPAPETTEPITKKRKWRNRK